MNNAALTWCHGSAVGTGIANSIYAAAAEPDGPESWVHFCITAASEAYESVMLDPPLEPLGSGPAQKLLAELTGRTTTREPMSGKTLEDAAHAAGSMAFRCCLPPITGRKQIQAFIACIVAGMQRGWLNGKDGSALLYPCQLALAAYPKRRSQSGRK